MFYHYDVTRQVLAADVAAAAAAANTHVVCNQRGRRHYQTSSNITY